MVAVPELKHYINKNIKVELNGNRKIQGKLIGYDFFLNLTVAECIEVRGTANKPDYIDIGTSVIRGNSVINIELV